MAASRIRAVSLVLLVVGVAAGGCAIEGEDDPRSMLRRPRTATATSKEDADLVADDDALAAAPRTETYPSGNPEVAVGKVDGKDVDEGDILRAPTRQGIAGAKRWAKRWPKGVVPFVIAPGMKGPERFTQAVKHWEANTPIRFVPRTTEADYVNVFNGEGCYSYLGTIGGKQDLSLAEGCTTGSAVHEIGHAVGLEHEQNRQDRDSFVKVIPANIEEKNVSQYEKMTVAAIGAYDFDSIMHYGSTYFALPGKLAMTKLDGSEIVPNRRGLSKGDIAGVKELYADVLAGAPAAAAPAAIDVRWNRKGPTAEYSLDVVVLRGRVIAPCIDAGVLKTSTSVSFRGTCKAGSVAAPISEVAELRICWAEGGNWAAASCAGVPYDGTSASVVIPN